MLVLIIAALGFCYLLHRLSVQSSYYADPTRRLCGTLDRMFNLLSDATEWVEGKLKGGFARLTGRAASGVVRRHREDLSIYYGISQWWWPTPKRGFMAPDENVRAVRRFKERREQMELPEIDFH